MVAGGPEPSVFIPTLEPVTLGHMVELDLGLAGHRPRYRLLGLARWFRRGGSGRRLLPGVSLSIDPVASLTLSQLARDSRYHSFLFTRNNPRIPAATSVRLHLPQSPQGSHPVAAHLADLSRSGAFVALPGLTAAAGEPEPVLIELASERPDRAERLLVTASVRWRGFLNGQKGFGCSFLNPDDRVKAEISRLLAVAVGLPRLR